MTTHRKAQPTAKPWSLRPVSRWAVALGLVGAMGAALGQGAAFEPSPEFEAWIAEAEKVKKDPVDFALERGRGEDWASKLDVYLVKRKLARSDGELARAKAEGAKLDAELAQKKAEGARLDAALAQKNAEIAAATKGIVAAMKSLDAQGRMGPKAVADLNWLFNNGSEEEKALIRRELGKYLKP